MRQSTLNDSSAAISQSFNDMSRKPRTRQKTKPVRPVKFSSSDPFDALSAASAQALALPIDPAWRPAIRQNLHLLFRHAALVDEFLLPDDIEPAPVFRA